jgi:hypothetical protein
MVPKYRPGRGYEVLTRYLDGTWFKSTPEGIVLSCGFLLEIEQLLLLKDDDESTDQYLYLRWAIKYLFQSMIQEPGLSVTGIDSLDFWEIEVYDMKELKSMNDDDDAASSSSHRYTTATATATATATVTHEISSAKWKNEKRRQLKKKKIERSSNAQTLLILVDILVPCYAMGVDLKTALDIIYQLSLIEQGGIRGRGSLSKIIRFMYLQQLKYYTSIPVDSDPASDPASDLPGGAFFFQWDALKVLSGDIISNYNMDLVALSTRPLDDERKEGEEEYYEKIPWHSLEKVLNGTIGTEEGEGEGATGTSEENGAWYDHLLILSSGLDAGDVLLLVFLPFGIVLGFLVIFQSYSSIHDGVLGEMGYEIQYGEDSSHHTTGSSNSRDNRLSQEGKSNVELMTY